MESFAKIVKGFQPLTVFAKLSISDVSHVLQVSNFQVSELWQVFHGFSNAMDFTKKLEIEKKSSYEFWQTIGEYFEQEMTLSVGIFLMNICHNSQNIKGLQ